MTGLHQRFSKTLCLTITVAMLAVASGCSSPEMDPSEQTIPTDSNQWQQELGDTFERLPAEDREVLSRYMLRMKLSEAYESGAMPRTTIEQALIQQREYERLHPNNPTGAKRPVVTSPNALNAETYPVSLLPVKSSENDSINQVKLQFMLSNHGTVPIESFQGTLLMTDANLKQGKAFAVPLTAFEPPIDPEQSGKIIINSSIEDINVMRAIKNTRDMEIVIRDGTVLLTDGQRVDFAQTLAE